MNDIHSAHGTTSVVKHPLLILVHIGTRLLLAQFVDDEADDGLGIIAVCADSSLGKIVQVFRLEDVELIQAGIEIGVKCGEQGQEDCDETELLDAARAILGSGAWFSAHDEFIYELSWLGE